MIRIQKLTGIISHLKAAFSEDGGKPSFSRYVAGVIVGSTIFWVTYLVLTTHAMPDLAGPTLFMTSGASATYGANKVSTMLSTTNVTTTPDKPDTLKERQGS